MHDDQCDTHRLLLVRWLIISFDVIDQPLAQEINQTIIYGLGTILQTTQYGSRGSQ
jgi:hypothetical protein